MTTPEPSKKHYIASACIVWCFDNRFTKSLQDFIKSRGFLHYDLVEIAGGAKSLSSPSSDEEREFVLKQIQTSIKLHQASRIILANHVDCGAYGGSKAFNNDFQEERQAHKRELEAARRFLGDNLPPECKIETIFVDFEKIEEVSS